MKIQSKGKAEELYDFSSKRQRQENDPFKEDLDTLLELIVEDAAKKASAEIESRSLITLTLPIILISLREPQALVVMKTHPTLVSLTTLMTIWILKGTILIFIF